APTWRSSSSTTARSRSSTSDRISARLRSGSVEEELQAVARRHAGRREIGRLEAERRPGERRVVQVDAQRMGTRSIEGDGLQHDEARERDDDHGGGGGGGRGRETGGSP